MTITYDSTELVGATYIPRYAQHDSSPERKINSVKLARQDGEVIIDDNFGVKIIEIRGVITGTSQANLEANIDTFKELISRKDKNLDIGYSSGTRRYVCRSISHEITRDHFHMLHAPYVVRFLVAKGYGTDTAETTALNKSGITATTDDEAITFSGSQGPKPRHKITLTTRGNADVVRIENVDTGDYIDVDLDGFVNTDYLEIDEENQTVKKNGTTNLNYRGKFPSVVAGSAVNLRLTVYGSGSTLDQQQNTDDATRAAMYDDGSYMPRPVQSFVPSQSGRIHKVTLNLDKTGSPGGNVQALFKEDNNNNPGDNVDTGVYEIACASVGAAQADNDLTLSSGNRPFLVKGRRYWLYLNSAVFSGTDASNFIGWYQTSDPTDYAYGKAMYYDFSASVYKDGLAGHPNIDDQNDMRFKIYRGDGGAASHSIVWQIYYTKKYL